MGKIRSAGVTDLRFRALLDEDWRFGAKLNLVPCDALGALQLAVGSGNTRNCGDSDGREGDNPAWRARFRPDRHIQRTSRLDNVERSQGLICRARRTIGSDGIGLDPRRA